MAETDFESRLDQWWNGKYATGEWFGLRPTLEDHGIKLGVDWKANILFNVAGGLERRGGYDDEWKFRATIDAAKLTGWDTIKGLSFYVDGRYRGGAGVNKYVGSSGQFAPSPYQGSRLWRFQNAYVTYTTPELFGVKEFFTISGGWQNPADVFFRQQESRLFLNNTFTTNRGIGANSIGWGGGYAAWGGYLRVKPIEWAYIQSGLYMAIPDANQTSNHGLFFAGAQPPDRNGIYWLTETGVTPKLGSSKLPGKYATGFLYWGVENTSYLAGETYNEKLLFYWQADQMLFREPSRSSEVVSDGKSVAGKEVVADAKPKLNDQGLYFFSQINFAPKYNNAQPFYLQTGLVYKGLIPYRDDDRFGIALAYGNYSYYKQLADEKKGTPAQTYEGVIEFSYRFQINDWAYVQPDLQYIFNPGGRREVANATVIGMQLGVVF